MKREEERDKGKEGKESRGKDRKGQRENERETGKAKETKEKEKAREKERKRKRKEKEGKRKGEEIGCPPAILSPHTTRAKRTTPEASFSAPFGRRTPTKITTPKASFLSSLARLGNPNLPKIRKMLLRSVSCIALRPRILLPACLLSMSTLASSLDTTEYSSPKTSEAVRIDRHLAPRCTAKTRSEMSSAKVAPVPLPRQGHALQAAPVLAWLRQRAG